VRRRTLVATALACLVASTACAGAGGQQASMASSGMNELTAQERADGWELLFDGHSLDGWRGYNRQDMPDGWAAQDGTLTTSGRGDGDIITDRTFTDFELSLDWRVEAGGNSGVFYRAAEGQEQIYWSAPEMQVLDDERHPDGQDPRTSAGSDYALYGAERGVVHPAGEWNHVRIVVRGSHVEHWLNGVRVVTYDLGSSEWERLVAASKFADWPAYGRAASGHIGLQDHGDPVWFRNIKIRELE